MCLSFLTVASKMRKGLPLLDSVLLRTSLQRNALALRGVTWSTPGSLHLKVRGCVAPFPAPNNTPVTHISHETLAPRTCPHTRMCQAITSFHGFNLPSKVLPNHSGFAAPAALLHRAGEALYSLSGCPESLYTCTSFCV